MRRFQLLTASLFLSVAALAQLPVVDNRHSATAQRMPLPVPAAMQELLTPSAPAVTQAAADGIITTQPQGESSTRLYGSSTAYYLQYGYIISDKSDGFIGRTVVNGDKLYLYQPFSLFPSGSWIVGTIVGDTVTFKPQPVFNHTSSQGVNTTYYMRRISYTEGGTSYTAPDDSADVKFLYRDGSLRMVTDGVMAMVDDKKQWTGFGDAQVEFSLLTDETVTLPDGLTPQRYTLYYSLTDSTGEVMMMDVARQGDTYYFGHMVPDMGDNWIRGTREGNAVTLDLPQYLGPDTLYNYHFYAFPGTMAMEYFDLFDMWVPTPKLSASPFVLSVDDATGQMASDSLLILNMGKQQVFYLSLLNKPVIRPFADKAGKPNPPFFTKYDPYQERYGNGYVQFAFNLTTEDGDYMDPDKLFYSLYVNGAVYEFKKSMYKNLTENLTEVPYTFNDSYDFDIQDDGSRRVYFYEQTDQFAVQAIYKGGGERMASDLVTLDAVAMGIGAPASQTQRVASAAYYDLSGRRLSAPAEGFCVKVLTMADGTRRIYKVVRQ